MITIKDYKTLREYLSAFSEKQLNLLIIVSRGGLGKTFLAEETLMKQGPVIFSGHVTPLGMYKELYENNRNENDFICIFDDVDALMMNKSNVAILKQLCDTRQEKTIKYFTTSPIAAELPSEFETQCKVLMLMNDIKTEDKNLNALLTRAHLIYFDPPDTEIIEHISKYAKDKEILDFMKQYSPFSKTLNLRAYKKAEELKLSGLDWKEEITSMLNIDSRLLEIGELMSKYKTDKERETHFSESRMQFYRYKKLFLMKTNGQKNRTTNESVPRMQR